jgi:hypothetical protein
MKFTLFVGLVVFFFSHVSFAITDTVIWKGVYYSGIPNKKNVSMTYCKRHTPGTFIHSVNKLLLHGVSTDKGIRLDHATFSEVKKNGLYFMSGELMAHGKTHNKSWNDHIYYHLYKLTENGKTQGVWRTMECKGLYTGVIIKRSYH